MLDFLQETLVGIHFGFSFHPCSAAVRAQHMELALKAYFPNARRIPGTLEIKCLLKIASWRALGSILVPSGLDFEGSGVNFFDIFT